MDWTDHGEHILTLDDYFDDILIDEIINDFERADKLGLTLSRKQLGGNHITQRDQSLFYDQMSDAIASGRTREIVNAINGDILDSWLEKYPVIDSGTYEELFVSNIKVQRTSPQGGYHNFHSEHCNLLNSKHTLLAFMLYLNDVYDGGETEFLYQSLRLKPRKNRFVLWPAGFTHLHRGNPPLKSDKYIVTGWIEYV